MSEEEIEKRIEHCEMMELAHREVGNIRSAERFNKEKYKWEKILEKLNPKIEEELRTYKIGYNNLQQRIDKVIRLLGDLGTQLIIIDNSDYVYSQEEVVNKVFEYQNKALKILQEK